MAKREIIKIDEEKCTGCGKCIPGCPEGALQLIDGKARLISDLFCDGLGACIGECPEDAITIEEREAEPYDEVKVMANVARQGKNVIRAHLEHLKNHGQTEFLNQAVGYLEEKGIPNPIEDTEAEVPGLKDRLPCGCPGSKVMDLRENEDPGEDGSGKETMDVKQKSELRQWPVQITLVPPTAPYFAGADLLIAADCVPFAYGNFHRDFLKGKRLLIGCPKLDDAQFYKDKITQVFKLNDIKSVTVANMEVPCCYGLVRLVSEALNDSGKDIPISTVTVGVSGEILEEQRV